MPRAQPGGGWVIEFRWNKPPGSLEPYTTGGEWSTWAAKPTLEEAIEYLLLLISDNKPNKNVYLTGMLGVRLREHRTNEVIPAELFV